MSSDYHHRDTESTESGIAVPSLCSLCLWVSVLRLPLNLDQADAVRARLVNEQIACPGHPHVPDDADSGGNDPALKFLSLRIEAHERVGSHSRLVVPDDVVRRRLRRTAGNLDRWATATP